MKAQGNALGIDYGSRREAPKGRDTYVLDYRRAVGYTPWRWAIYRYLELGGQIMARRWVGWLGCFLLLGGIVGCGSRAPSAPSDGDSVNAVKEYFEKIAGIGGEYRYKVAEVRVIKRGKYFKRELGGGSEEGYPVRVLVKGAATSQLVYDDAAKPFEEETDIVMHYLPPDPRKVDQGSGRWVAGR